MGKQRIKLSASRRRQLWRFGVPVLLVVGGLWFGWLAKTLIVDAERPKNMVWAIDNTVDLPADLRYSLLAQNGCQSYRGPGTPQGVGLWGVQQISKGRFAKVIHGCSWSLESYVMIVKVDDHWQLLDPKTYYPQEDGNTGRGALPACEALERYGIDKSIEPFCIPAKGTARANDIE